MFLGKAIAILMFLGKAILFPRGDMLSFHSFPLFRFSSLINQRVLNPSLSVRRALFFLAADYQARDSWIALHINRKHHSPWVNSALLTVAAHTFYEHLEQMGGKSWAYCSKLQETSLVFGLNEGPYWFQQNKGWQNAAGSTKVQLFLYGINQFKEQANVSLPFILLKNWFCRRWKNQGLQTKALFTSPVFSPPKDVGIYGDLVFTKYPQIPSNTLPQKYSTIMESF
jgi:hypothetical protein